MNAKRVYTVTYINFDTGDCVFRNVYFTREAAEKFINHCKFPEQFEITEFVETTNGDSEEV